MSNQENIDLLIDDYLKNRLKAEELEEFNRSLGVDESLKAKVELHKFANELVINNKLNAISDLSKQVANEIESKKRIKKYLISGAVLIILGTAVYLFTKPKVVHSGKVSIVDSNENNVALNEVLDTNKPIVSNESVSSSSIKVKVAISESKAAEAQVPQNISPESKPAVIVEEGKAVKEEKATSEEKEVLSVPSNTNMFKNLCENVHISADISTKGSCEGQFNGAINVANISGGHAPYTTAIYDEHGHVHSPSKGFSKGGYSVRVMDVNGCMREFLHTVVKELNCREDFHFNPFIGEVWELPSNGLAAELHVFERSSGLYYEKSFQASEQLHWNGQANKGDVKEGYFVFEIIYSDGSRKNGSITVVK